MEWVYDPPTRQNADSYFEEFSVLGSSHFDQQQHDTGAPIPFGEFTMNFDTPFISSNNENNKAPPQNDVLHESFDAELRENNSEPLAVDIDTPFPTVHETKPRWEYLKKKGSVLFKDFDEMQVVDIDDEESETRNYKNEYPLKKLDEINIRPSSSPEHSHAKQQPHNRPQTVVNPSQRPFRTAWN